MDRLPNNAVLLCGAGASRDSGLPDGQTMAQIAFDEVWAGTRVYAPEAANAVRDALRWPSSGEPELRLELILDLMARDVAPAVLAGVYSVVLNAEPCLAHYALASATVPIVTTNQDELVEDAARRMGVTVDVLHLHGRASDPASIVTMLSQYVDGLPKDTTREFRARIAGSHLVVLGYSGRDLDVMPFLHNATRVTWLHFQAGGGPGPATEVRQLQASLGRRMRIIEHSNPVQWLVDRLSSAARAAVAASRLSSAGRAAASLSDSARIAFRRLPLVNRRLAVARVLLHVNQADLACQGLRRALVVR